MLKQALDNGAQNFHDAMASADTVVKDLEYEFQKNAGKAQTPDEKQGVEIANAVLAGLQAITHESVVMSDKLRRAEAEGLDQVIEEAVSGLFDIGREAASMVGDIKQAQTERLTQLKAAQEMKSDATMQLEDLMSKKLIQLNDGSLAVLDDDWFMPQLQIMYEDEMEQLSAAQNEISQLYFGY